MTKQQEVALAVKGWMAAQGLKITDVAERLGVSVQAVSSQLSGDRPFGRMNATRYAEIFKLNANYLMTGEGQLVAGDPAEGDAPQASAQEKVERLLATIESQQRTIEILARKLG